MILQPSSLHHQNKALPFTPPSSSQPLSCKNPNFAPTKSLNYHTTTTTTTTTTIRCSYSISQVHSYGTMDYERRPMMNWNSVYKKIVLMENPELGAGSVLTQCENQGKKLTKWELSKIVKELRKFKRYNQALEVYDWISNREERFKLSASDAAVQLDLIAKVRGITASESFFNRIPHTLKDRRVYGAMLNAYVHLKLKEKAESLIEEMKNKGYTTHALPFNVMMTLYMNFKEYDKVDLIILEMMERKVKLDIYSYNIWLTSRGSQGSIERMEEVFEHMKLDKTINPNWTTFSTMATMYIKMGQSAKAEDCLRRLESRITGRDRMPYHYLLSLYGNIGNKEEVYRVWNVYKSVFPSITNLGYHAIISSLVRIGDIEGAENIYEEWLQTKMSYDPRLGNLLMSFYVKDGKLDKAMSFFDHMVQDGCKPNSSSWEILAEGHIGNKSITQALNCFKEAFAIQGPKGWKPKPMNVTSFFERCEKQADSSSKEVLLNLLTTSGFLQNKKYASLLGLSNEPSSNQHWNEGENETEESEEDDGYEIQLGELQV